MPQRKPIIGLAGGIGSGKSLVARILADLGCQVIDSDEQVRKALLRPDVRQTLVEWWGQGILHRDGSPNRSAIAARVFADPAARQRLEGLLHPLIAAERDRIMSAAANDPNVLAFVWDAPLLFEADLARHCDAVIFVDAPDEVRLGRVGRERNWSPQELRRRESTQWPLDKKRQMADHVIANSDSPESLRPVVRRILSTILAARSPQPGA